MPIPGLEIDGEPRYQWGSVHRRKIFEVVEDHPRDCFCQQPTCSMGPRYWENWRSYWRQKMDEFKVEWDPTITF